MQIMERQGGEVEGCHVSIQEKDTEAQMRQ